MSLPTRHEITISPNPYSSHYSLRVTCSCQSEMLARSEDEANMWKQLHLSYWRKQTGVIEDAAVEKPTR